jgi:hypothetical protein
MLIRLGLSNGLLRAASFFPDHACRQFSVVGEDDRVVEDFAGFRVDGLRHGDDACEPSGVAVGARDGLFGGWQLHLSALDELFALLFKLLDDEEGFIGHRAL